MTSLSRNKDLTTYELKRLKYVARLQYGESLSSDHRDDSGSIPVFGSNGIVGYHSRPNTQHPMIVVGRKGSYGQVTYSQLPGFCIDTTYFVDNRSCREDLRWLYYALQTLGLDSFSQDTGVPGLSREHAYEKVLPVPVKSVQLAIANFLDTKTSAIDNLIRKKERLIEVLQEKRQAVITRAVTMGLNPSVPMKDSGILGVGTIPVSWDIKRLKHLALRRGSGIQMGPFGSMLTNVLPFDSGYKLYGQQNTLRSDFSVGSRWLDERTFHELIHYAITPGDILLTRKGSIGNACIAPDNIQTGIADSDTIRVRLDKDFIYTEFIGLVLNGAKYINDQILMNKRGAVLVGLNTTTISELTIAVPSLEEQHEIVGYLKSRLAKIDSTIQAIENQCGQLKSYRQTLITAAITGKIDVRQYVEKRIPAAQEEVPV